MRFFLLACQSVSRNISHVARSVIEEASLVQLLFLLFFFPPSLTRLSPDMNLIEVAKHVCSGELLLQPPEAWKELPEAQLMQSCLKYAKKGAKDDICTCACAGGCAGVCVCV